MAKKTAAKTQAIKDALAADPKAGPQEIAEKLVATGLDVKPKDVSNVKFQEKSKRRRKKRAAKGEQAAPVPKRAATAPAAGDMISMTALQAAKKLVKELGGVEKAKRAIESLGRLVD